ncbi:MAG: penicillin-binding protein activator LpoB [Treponemataceae bacterium]|nr:penicillin-binding protein activator LpoB [Treponemataceae bacterium]
MKKLITIVSAFLVASLVFAAPVKRTDDTKDLAEFWNENDIKIVCTDIINEVVRSPRIDRFERDNDRAPVVIIGRIENESNERIDTSIVEKKLENAIINSGVCEFIADRSQRDILHDELRYQSDHASVDTAKEMDEELGADFMLNGSVKTVVEVGKKQTQKTYHVVVQMIDLQTHRVVFSTENDEITKLYKNTKKKI